MSHSLELVVRVTPVSILQGIEHRAQFHQGKGWGSYTVIEETEAILRFAKRKGISKVRALDIGANRGSWTEAILKTNAQAEVCAFEPSKKAFEVLEGKFKGLERVRLFNVAIGKETKDGILFSDSPASGLASLTKRRLSHQNVEFSLEERIKIVSLDDWHRQNNFKFNVIKMDVEGHEYEVLLGAQESLGDVSIIQFEFGPCNIDTRTFFKDFWYFFQDKGFAIWRLGPKGLHLLETYSDLDEVFRTTNFFAVRK